jgi:hypothetical protein
MVAAMSYAVCVNFVAFYRIPADALGASTVGMQDHQVAKEDLEARQMDPSSGKIVDGGHATEVEQSDRRLN